MKNLWIKVKQNLSWDNFKTGYVVNVRDEGRNLYIQVKAFSYSGAIKQIKRVFKNGFIVNIEEIS